MAIGTAISIFIILSLIYATIQKSANDILSELRYLSRKINKHNELLEKMVSEDK